MKKAFIIFVFYLLNFACQSQTPDDYYGIVGGYENKVIQAGISKGKVQSFLSERKSVTLNYDLQNNRPGLTGSYLIGALFCLGIDMTTYYKKDFEAFIKPKVGVGFPNLFSVNYGYAIPLYNSKGFDVFSFDINIPIKQTTGGQNGTIMFGLIKL